MTFGLMVFGFFMLPFIAPRLFAWLFLLLFIGACCLLI